MSCPLAPPAGQTVDLSHWTTFQPEVMSHDQNIYISTLNITVCSNHQPDISLLLFHDVSIKYELQVCVYMLRCCLGVGGRM